MTKLHNYVMSQVRVRIENISINPVVREVSDGDYEFHGDYVWECNLCDLGSGKSGYHVAVNHATQHASTVHPELVVVSQPEGVYFE